MYVGNDPATYLAELSEEQFVRTRPSTWQGSSVLQRGPDRPRGSLLCRNRHPRPKDLSVLGCAVTADSDGQ